MITEIEAATAVGRLAALRYFPGDDLARAEIAELLMRMVCDQVQLEWLIRKCINDVGEWRGPRELRVVFCERFKPADAIEPERPTPSHHRLALPPARPQDGEVTEADRQFRAELERKIALLAARERRTGPPARYRPPVWLENL